MTMTEDYATTNGHRSDAPAAPTNTVTLDDGQGGEMTVNRKAWTQIRALVDVLDSTDAHVFDRAVALVIADSLKPTAKAPKEPTERTPKAPKAAKS
jgi:hypothetical protein